MAFLASYDQQAKAEAMTPAQIREAAVALEQVKESGDPDAAKRGKRTGFARALDKYNKQNDTRPEYRDFWRSCQQYLSPAEKASVTEQKKRAPKIAGAGQQHQRGHLAYRR